MNRRLTVSTVLFVALAVASSTVVAQSRRGGGLGRLGSAVGAVGQAVGIDAPPPITSAVLLPSQVDPGWAALDPENPLAVGDDPVDYVVTSLASYDTYFFQVAQMEGTLTLARDTVHTLNETVNGPLLGELFSGALLVELAGEQGSVGPAEQQRVLAALISGNFAAMPATAQSLSEARFAQVRDEFFAAHPELPLLAERLPLATNGLIALPNQAIALASTVQALVTSAPSDFAGPQALNLPRISQELAGSVNSVTSMGQTSVEILNELRALIP